MDDELLAIKHDLIKICDTLLHKINKLKAEKKELEAENERIKTILSYYEDSEIIVQPENTTMCYIVTTY